MCGGGDDENDIEQQDEEVKPIKFRKPKIIIAVVLGLIGAGTAAIAYSLLSGHVDSLAIIVNVWDQKPITEVQFTNGSCPGGFEAFKGNESLQWCDSREKNGTVSREECEKSDTNGGSKVGYAVVNKWLGNTICIKRAGKNAFDAAPIKVDAKCPSGEIKCGNGTTSDSGYTTCAKSLAECPITKIAIQRNGSAVPTGNWQGSSMFYEQIYTEYRIPIAGKNSSKAFQSVVNVTSTVLSTLWYARGSGLPLKTLSLAFNKPCVEGGSTCATDFKDPRFKDVNEDSIEQVLLANGIPVQLKNATDKPRMSSRTDIKWISACPSKRAAVKSNLPAVFDLRTTQLVLLIVQLIVLFVVVLALNWKLWKEENAEEQADIQKKQKYYKLAGNVAKYVTTAIAIFIAIGISAFFATTAGGKCSDTYTNKTFDFLNEKIGGVAMTNAATSATDIAQAVVDYLPKVIGKILGG